MVYGAQKVVVCASSEVNGALIVHRFSASLWGLPVLPRGGLGTTRPACSALYALFMSLHPCSTLDYRLRLGESIILNCRLRRPVAVHNGYSVGRFLQAETGWLGLQRNLCIRFPALRFEAAHSGRDPT